MANRESKTFEQLLAELCLYELEKDEIEEYRLFWEWGKAEGRREALKESQ